MQAQSIKAILSHAASEPLWGQGDGNNTSYKRAVGRVKWHQVYLSTKEELTSVSYHHNSIRFFLHLCFWWCVLVTYSVLRTFFSVFQMLCKFQVIKYI